MHELQDHRGLRDVNVAELAEAPRGLCPGGNHVSGAGPDHEAVLAALLLGLDRRSIYHEGARWAQARYRKSQLHVLTADEDSPWRG